MMLALEEICYVVYLILEKEIDKFWNEVKIKSFKSEWQVVNCVVTYTW